MIKVIIVDDEYIERTGMEKTINWSKYGCDFCGSAENGLDGVELANKVKPDIVITDIRMPGLDGISMSKKIKEKLPDCKFIIITGYADFEYAQSAVKINAFDFLLKPIKDEEFANSLQNACKASSESKNELYMAREKSLLNIMTGNISKKDDITAVLSAYSINLSKVILVGFLNNSPQIDGSGEYIKNKLSEYFKCESYIVACSKNHIVLIENANDLFKLENFYNKIQDLQNKPLKKMGITVTIGISASHSVYNLKQAYLESREALNFRIYMGRGSIILFSKMKSEKSVNWNWILEMVGKITVKLRACDRVALDAELKSLYLTDFKKFNVENNVIQQTCINILFHGIDVLNEYGIPADRVFSEKSNIYRDIIKYDTLEELYLFIRSNLFKIIDCIKETNSLIYENDMENVLGYIKANYCRDISLTDVSDVACLNENYLCRKFKKTFGVSFTEYITRLRMEKAMKYLMNSKMKITEIARSVGYPNYRYFSQKFKNFTGYLPSQWQMLKVQKCTEEPKRL